jgi:FKBP-type peptidyl-prolyl cis-trans isomerase FkpA
MATSRLLFVAAATLASSVVFAQASAPAAGSGLIYKSIKDGSGAQPVATDVVKVHYRGTLQNGTEFDSSHKRGQPAEFPLNRVIKCWTEGVQKMKVGGKAQLTCPPGIAYGERGTPGGPIPPNATLNFEVELLGINGK